MESPSQEKKLAIIHRVLVSDSEYPREYVILITDVRSIFIRQPKTRSSFSLRGEMKWGTALVTDVVPKTLDDYKSEDLDTLSRDPMNFAVPHDAVVSLGMKAERPEFRRRDFIVRWTMKMQKEVFQVYKFELSWRGKTAAERLQFYAVPLGAWFKPKRQTQTREAILKDYADEILEIYRRVVPPGTITGNFVVR